MDINSLLSPSDSPRTSQTQKSKAPAKKTRRARASSNLANAYVANPTLSSIGSQTSVAPPSNGGQQLHNPGSTAGDVAVAQGFRANAAVTPPAEGLRSSRQPSTPGMDALADLASMQHHQQIARANAGGLRNAEIYDSQATTTSNVPAIPRSQATTHILRGTSFDRSMIEAPTQTPSPRQFTTRSLSEAEQGTVTQLAAHLAVNPFAYEAHVNLINILHQGLINCPHPSRYDLLQDLQVAREAMASRFALGEDLLADWVRDKIMLADTFEARISVMELCQKTVEEEPNSTKLWRIYGEWMLSLYKNANDMDERLAEVGPILDGPRWSEDDRTVAREIFTWQIMMDVWKRGAQATMLMINDSHLLWDTYKDLRLLELATSPSQEAFANLEMEFQNRLRIPHATWDQTFQAYSTFINQYDKLNYTDAMLTLKENTVETRRKYEVREFKELNLLRAAQAGDREAELRSFHEYIEYETGLNRKKKIFDFDLLNALYQRATLRFPANTDLWETYVMFYNEELTVHDRHNISAIPVLEQATRHCPWSGNLWSLYLLAAEMERMPFAHIGQIKHKATSTGLLDAGSMDEILKVHTAWSGFLRRRAFQDGASEEDADVAEVGIRSAIEDMETVGRTKFGETFQGDPQYRLERIYIQYLTQARQWDTARQEFRQLVHRKGDSYEFWLRWYSWELTTWCKLAFVENGPNGGKFTKPTEATKVLQQALKRSNLDWPEKLIEAFQYHCEDHEDAAELQAAIVQVSKAEKAVKKRREKEAYQAYEAAQAQGLQQQHQQQTETVDTVGSIEENRLGKRKRNDNSEDGPSKKSREVLDHTEPQLSEQETSAPTILKRDRENAAVLVKNLPVNATETKVRQYFRDCGTINSLKILPEPDGNSATASIEFESKEDVLTAQTKDMKTFDGTPIEVSVGGGSTIYVCNFPSTADEQWIRNKFQQYGDIVEVRFPSLKYNTHRRFCYVQFKLASQAEAATELDGQDQGDGLKLLAKISDPAHKKSREGAMYEGRELYVANLDWNATEKDVKEAFKKYGYIEGVRIPKKINGRSKGMGFIVFRDKEAATAALEMDQTVFRNRTINVALSTANKADRPNLVHSSATSLRASGSPAPRLPGGTDNAENNAASPGSNTSLPTKDNSAQRAEIQSRILALLNIPDTVNDARIRSLCAPYGTLVRVQLRPSHGGAIIEYKDVASVGKASLALEGHEIAPGRLLSIGTVADLHRAKAEFRSDKLSERSKNTTSLLQNAIPIRRPRQPDVRRGGRGGLGVKRAPRGANDADGDGDDAKKGGGGAGAEGQVPKSNADFREMLLKKK